MPNRSKWGAGEETTQARERKWGKRREGRKRRGLQRVEGGGECWRGGERREGRWRKRKEREERGREG